MKIYTSINKNIDYLTNLNNNSADIVSRIIDNKIGYIFLESVSSDDKISNFLNKSILKRTTIRTLYKSIKNKIYNSNLLTNTNLDELFTYLASGFTIIFVEGYSEAIIVETKNVLDRGIVESTVEPIIRGPKDSFTENYATNIGLIRKRIKDNNLFFDEIKIGRRSKTKVSVVYINDIADKEKVKKIKDKLNCIDIDAIIDSAYIREFMEDDSTVFPKVISTERPDLTCTSLLDGKIIIMVENTPVVLIFPGLFVDFFHSPEDYYQKPLNVSFSRFLRLICFFITISVPAIYIALMTFNPEIIPDQLLISLATQREGVPFPTAIEVLIFVIIFEILREADIHSPNISGSAISIVGALILGDAAVNAGVVSPIVIIVVAITSISELVFYDVDMINAVREWRIIFIVASLAMGLIGLVVAIIIFITKLVSLECLDIPYLTPITPNYFKQWKDAIIRLPRNKLKDRPKYLAKNIKRMSDNEKNSI